MQIQYLLSSHSSAKMIYRPEVSYQHILYLKGHQSHKAKCKGRQTIYPIAGFLPKQHNKFIWNSQQGSVSNSVKYTHLSNPTIWP